MTIAYQGAPGAFSEEAALALAHPDRDSDHAGGVALQPCPTLDDVFDAMAAGRVDAAVVPIENTLAGPVPGCADLLERADVHVAAECVLRIEHALIAPRGVAMADVRRVLSHPVAIAQCRGFLRRHPHMRPVAAIDTAGAVAELIDEQARDAAAIASRRAAAVYGGVVLADAIQDRADNFTRFLRVERGRHIGPLHGARKTSLVCWLPNQPGALLRALEPFAANGLNLTRIESRPVRESPFEYAFHIDVAPAADEQALDAALQALAMHAREVRVIGNYVERSRKAQE